MKSLKQIKKHIVDKFNSSKKCHPWIYKEHVLVVEHYARQLLKIYPQADKKIVFLSVWFHDIGRAEGKQKGHDLFGANYAKKFLTKQGFNKKIIDGVYHACLTHSNKEHNPKTLEAKILSTADGLAHFHQGFYLRILSFRSRELGYEKARETLFKKIHHDYHIKICFDQIRQKVKPMYQAWQRLIEKIDL